MRLKNFDLIAAMLIAAINLGWTQVPNRSLLVGIILAIPMILILPGYTLTQVLFRKRSVDQSTQPSSDLILRPSLKIGQPVGGADQIILSLGLSLAIDVLVGFTLNVFPIGLQALSWVLALGLLTTLFALLATFLRRRDIVRVVKGSKLHITINDCILFGLAILVATTAVWLSIIRPLEPQPSFTQFWMLPTNTNSCSVSIGVQSFETTSVTYRIVVLINGTQADNWSSITLGTREKWVRSVSIKPSASNMFIEAQLYRMDQSGSPYRNVHLTFHIPTGGKHEPTQQCTT